MHHPAGATRKPGKIEQPSVDGSKSWQLAHLLPALKAGWATLLASSV
jgi:hypothetical protein